MKRVVIIGSGIGGLTAGNLLAKKGHSVTILESHNMPGGYTAGFYRNGCYFESGTICFESAQTVFRAMKAIGVMDKIGFEKMGMGVVSEYFQGIPQNFEEFKSIIYDAFPAEKERLDKAFADAESILSVFAKSSKMPLPAVISKTEMLKSMLSLIPSLPKTLKVMNEFESLKSSEFALRYFEKNSTLYELFNKFSYPDASAILLVSAMAGVFEDVWTVKEGMQSWANVLADSFRANGGELKLKSYVDSIVTRKGAAIGVCCKDKFYEADAVISAGDYKKTFLEIIDDKSLIPEKLRNSIENAAISEGFFTVYIALDMQGEELREHLKNPHVFCMDSKPDCDIYDSEDGDYFSKAPFYLYSPSMVNPALAPQGKCSLMIQCRAVDSWMNRWGGGNKDKYRQLKAKAMNDMIDRAAQLIPGLREHIEYKDSATPLTYERFTHNTGGASTAWSSNPKKGFFKNALGTNIKTPVKNLYIGSCWAVQLGGVPGAVCAAYKCAKKIK